MDNDKVTVSEAAKLLGVTSTTLRNWDKNGLLKPSRDSSNSYRLYSLGEVLRMKNSHQDSSVDEAKQTNELALRSAIKKINNTFRDSRGGGVLYRLEELTKVFFCKMLSEIEGPDIFATPLVSSDVKLYESINKLYKNAVREFPYIEGTRAELGGDIHAIAESARILSNIRLTKLKDDVKGKIFEDVIANTFDKNENQQFFTPRPVVDFMVEATKSISTKIVLDPACGTGGFLIAASTANPQAKIVGLEIDGFMAWVSHMNLFLHNSGHYQINLFGQNGSLGREAVAAIPENSVDLIITNPPFGSDMSGEVLKDFSLGMNKKSRRRGILFVERCIHWLKPGGQMAIVLEDSVLNGQSNQDVRQFILENCDIKSIVSLPEVAFKPYASVKTSILFVIKKNSRLSASSDTLFFEAENVGRKPNGDDDLALDGRPVTELPDIAKVINGTANKGESKSFEHFSLDLSVDSEDYGVRLDYNYHHPLKKDALETLRSIPYDLSKLGDIVEAINKSVVPKFEDPDFDIDFVGLAHIESGTGKYTIQKVKGDKIKSSVKIFEAGDILFSKMRPELRKTCLIKNGHQGYASSECLVLRIKDSAKGLILSEYLEALLRSDLVFGQVVYQITGIGRPRLTKTSLFEVQIPVPSLDKQRQIIIDINAVLTESSKLMEKSREIMAESINKVSESHHKITTLLST